VFHSGLMTRGFSDFSGSWGHGFRCRTNGSSSRNIGGEFVGNVPKAGLLSKLDAGAPYDGWIFGSGLRLYSEKKAEKIPVVFNSKKSFAKVNKDSNVANRIRVEVMELKPIEVKKASKERARGRAKPHSAKW
jgi:hypothetical protein